MDDYRKLYEEQDRWQILDVREPYEWDAGHVDGSIHVPLADVMAGREAQHLEKDRPVAVICRSGNRSELAMLMLQARGFEAVNVEGGAQGWVQAGLPLVDADGDSGRVV
jgi:rhodanese-related sulfurtransferase